MGYQGLVKPGGASNSIVMKQLNAQRDDMYAKRGFYR
jgi:hypothetical protein